MPTNFRSKSFSQSSINGDVVKQRGYDVAYDGEKAVIDALKNGELFRYELDKDEFFNLMKKYYSSNRSGSRSIKDTLMSDFDIDKTGLVGDLLKDKEYSGSLMSPMFSDVDESDVDDGSGVDRAKTRKRKRRRKKSRDTAKKRHRKHRK